MPASMPTPSRRHGTRSTPALPFIRYIRQIRNGQGEKTQQTVLRNDNNIFTRR